MNNDVAKTKPRILFFGTPEFAFPILAMLIKESYLVTGVITRPDEPKGRDYIITPPPIKVFAEKHNLPVFQPETLIPERWQNEIPEADLFIVAAYGKIIPNEILTFPRLGALNIHPSLLPRWRGPSPLQYTILSGDTETGVTLMLMDERMDHGSIIAQKKLSIGEKKITAQELHDTLSHLGAELLKESLQQWLAGTITPEMQDDTKATYSKIIKKDDGRIDWKKPAQDLERKIRAFTPWPGAWSLWPTEKQIYRVRVESAEISDEESPYGSPGYIWKQSKKFLLIKTGKGSLAVRRLTLGGKKAMSVAELIHGYPKLIGSTVI